MNGEADTIVWVCGVNMEWLGIKPNCTSKQSLIKMYLIKFTVVVVTFIDSI